MRPSQELLDHFSKLSEFDASVRRNASQCIITKIDELEKPEISDYCLSRLMSGLSSARAATRLGYTSTLTNFLMSDMHKKWTIDKLFEVANSKIDLADKTVGGAHAIGHYLLLVAIIHSRHYDEHAEKIIEHIKTVKENYPPISFSLVKLFADYSTLLDKKLFNKHAKNYMEYFLEDIKTVFTPENITLALQLREKHPKTISSFTNFIKQDGSCHFSNDDYARLLAALKRCDPSNVQIVTDLLLTASSGKDFETLYSKVIEPWALATTETKVLERVFGVATNFFDKGNDLKLLPIIFSKEIMNRMEMAVRGKGQFRLLRNSVTSFGNYIKEKLGNLKGDDAYQVLNELKTKGNIDRVMGISITTVLLGNLDEKHVNIWLKEAVGNEEDLRKIIAAFGSWSEKTKLNVLTALLKQETSDVVQTVVTSIIDGFFYIKTRPGEFASVQLSEHNESMLRQVLIAVDNEKDVKKAEKRLKKSTKRTQSLKVLWFIVKLWAKTASEEDSADYEADAEEILTIAENEDDENNSRVFIDFLIGILSKEKKFHRTPVAFSFAHSLPTLDEADLVKIIETATLSVNELVGDDEDEDMEDEDGMPFDESEISTKAMHGDEDEDDEDDDDEEEEEDEEEEDGNETVDQELLDKLNDALGDAAAKDGVSDKEMDELDDEEMMKMDERLAAAFKAMAPKNVLSKNKQNSKNVEALKMKIADLLLIAISTKSITNETKLNLIVPLLKWVKSDLKQFDAVAQRVIHLINVILSLKVDEIKKKKLVKLMNNVIEESKNVTNLLIIDVIADIISFIIKSAKNENKIEKTISDEFMKIYDEFFNNVEGKIPKEFVMKPITKYPNLFIEHLPKLIDSGFEEENRIFKKTEVLGAAAIICTKQVLKSNAIEKGVVKKMGKSAAKYLKKSLEDTSEIKPRLFATILKLICNLSTTLKDDDKLSATLAAELEEVLNVFMENETAAKMKKMNSPCQQIIGRSCSSAVNMIRNNLGMVVSK